LESGRLRSGKPTNRKRKNWPPKRARKIRKENLGIRGKLGGVGVSGPDIKGGPRHCGKGGGTVKGAYKLQTLGEHSLLPVAERGPVTSKTLQKSDRGQGKKSIFREDRR